MGDIQNVSDGVYCHRALVNIFCNLNQGFNIFHFNARSLNGNKMDYIRYVFEHCSADVICVTETWFNYDLPDSTYEIPNMVMFRNDRMSKRGGGIAVYCKKGLNARQIDNSSSSSLIEYINVEISGAACKLLLSCVYNPHRNNCFDNYFSALCPYLINYDFIAITGDFNVNMLGNDSAMNKLISLAACAGLKLVNHSTPTRYCNNTPPSLLDLFYISDMSSLVKFEQCSFISDHDLIFCCLDIPISCPLNKCTYSYRDFKNINYKILFDDLSKVRWNDCWFYDTVDDKLQWFIGIIGNIFDRHVVIKSKTSVTNSCPWFNNLVHGLIKKRNALHSKWRICPTEMHWLRYVKARNEATKSIKIAKQKYYSLLLNNSLRPKQLWQNIDKLRIFKKQSSHCEFSPDELNEYFASSSSSSNSDASMHKNDYTFHANEKDFEFFSISEDDVARHVYSISSNAVGHDGIPIKFIKIILPFILPTLTHITNHCFTTSSFPSLWKIATVIPIAKIKNPTNVADYRPISIIPAIAKVCEKIMYEQITHHLYSNHLLSPIQSGFREGHSCTTAMVKILDDIRCSNDENNITLLCLLDFSKAFDNILHNRLCDKLARYFHFGKTAINLIDSYLSNRMQRVKILDMVSSFADINKGVPQGSTLGPLLFGMYVNDLFMACNNCNVHAYADDVQLYISGPVSKFNLLIEKLNTDLQSVSDWTLSNGFAINVNKSIILPISKRNLPFSSTLYVKVGSIPLKVVNHAKNLGYIINTNLNGSDHISYIVGKIFSICRLLRKTAYYTPLETRRHLVIQLIMPYIVYAAPVLGKLDCESRRKLIVAYNCVIRYVFGLKRWDHTSRYKTKILGVGIIEYWDIRILLYLHQIMNRKSPSYLYDKLIWSRSTRTKNLVVPKYNHLQSSRLFFIHAVRLWNCLPSSIKNIVNPCTFKQALFSHYNTLNLS